MDLLNKKWLNPSKIKLTYSKGKMTFENTGKRHAFLVYPKLFKSNPAKEIAIKLNGNLISGTGCTAKILNRHKTILGQCGLNSMFVNRYMWLKYYVVVLYVPAESKNEITLFEHTTAFEPDIFDDYFSSDTLIVTPGYPSLENKYNTAFVHTRVKAYKKEGIDVDVAVINDYNNMSHYLFDGVDVIKGDFFFLRALLQRRKYKRIIIHFFDQRFANVLESVDTTYSKLYFYLHGAETLYRDWPKIVSPYFGPPARIDDPTESLFKTKDFYIKKYNDVKNATWVFVTEWTRSRCEELLGIKFKNSAIVPCLIDTELFSYEEKDPQLRKNIFVLRKFDDVNSYSLDTVVRIILELSHRPFFDDLHFDIYGDGSLHSEILKPVGHFKNVDIHKNFLNSAEIRKVHREHGIALFPTRFDSQAVSSCEAAASGCAVVTSDIPGVRQFIPADLGVMCQTENYSEYADVIEHMYNDSEYFLKVAREESASVKSKFDFEHTIKKDLDMFASEENGPYFNFGEISDSPVLTVIVPSYNVEKYLRNTVISMLDQRNAEKIEIIIVNDGSRDNTIDIARELEALSTCGERSIVKVIDKENGGHGSTINVGIRAARGKYVKVVDGDDTVDSEVFADLIDILEKEDSDVVLNNYIEDYAHDNIAVVKKIYTLLKPGIRYHFGDVCYPNYGFTTWGPILSCSSYKTSMLRQADFYLSEKMFYVDMELNINIAIACDTITYYDLDIYRYLLGRSGQSVSSESYKRNYKHHENVCMSMIKTYYENEKRLSESKKNYIVNNLILPMLSTQYEICINYRKDAKSFEGYDQRLKQYPEFYNNKRIQTGRVVFYRKTHGRLVRFNDIFIKLNGRLKH